MEEYSNAGTLGDVLESFVGLSILVHHRKLGVCWPAWIHRIVEALDNVLYIGCVNFVNM